EDYGLAAKTLTPEARAALLAYEWPGNVRQLANVMERVALLADATAVTAPALGLSPETPHVATAPDDRGAVLGDAMRDVERAHLLDALEKSDGNITQAAARLGLPRNTLRSRLDRHGLGLEAGSPRRRGGRPRGIPLRSEQPPAPAAEAPVGEPRRLTLLYVALIAPSSEAPSPQGTRPLAGVIHQAPALPRPAPSLR